MAKGKKDLDLSTEEKIMEAARKVFTEKGYAAARTRDIAEESGINLALLNYYFRSKEKLFELVMLEKVNKLFGTIIPILSDETTELEEKLDKIAESYIDLLLVNPDLPIFVLSEIRRRPEKFAQLVNAKERVTKSVFMKQLLSRKLSVSPFHILINLLGITVFPFVARPVLSKLIKNEEEYDTLMKQRKELIPMWIKTMLN
ncbi:TetR/AcrR family transcriptional regulator [Dyadobacter frigoris]|uniref:TetR/AcrR family transcriptional regulator n=1 Tax=Dyadobacter frigoris TaxID=2576211 RepID=A0A4U6CWB0_9BACT|nr:TetR/AcrR family transcriptional regulator [Dyadobacter frigoris]TKT88035.1 TetR/AcrR family transcriptional regulator [Dyadobacter frigoris]GLU52934.1 TetR family transcriptional regulator [Dyadobacter frigoris]